MPKDAAVSEKSWSACFILGFRHRFWVVKFFQKSPCVVLVCYWCTLVKRKSAKRGERSSIYTDLDVFAAQAIQRSKIISQKDTKMYSLFLMSPCSRLRLKHGTGMTGMRGILELMMGIGLLNDLTLNGSEVMQVHGAVWAQLRFTPDVDLAALQHLAAFEFHHDRSSWSTPKPVWLHQQQCQEGLWTFGFHRLSDVRGFTWK